MSLTQFIDLIKKSIFFDAIYKRLLKVSIRKKYDDSVIFHFSFLNKSILLLKCLKHK